MYFKQKEKDWRRNKKAGSEHIKFHFRKQNLEKKKFEFFLFKKNKKLDVQQLFFEKKNIRVKNKEKIK